MKLSDLLSLLGDLEKDHNKAYQLDLHSDGSGTIYSSVFGDEQTLSKFHSLAMLESLILLSSQGKYPKPSRAESLELSRLISLLNLKKEITGSLMGFVWLTLFADGSGILNIRPDKLLGLDSYSPFNSFSELLQCLTQGEF
jgi:hypothetical protein